MTDKNGQHFAAKKLLRSYLSMDEVWDVNEIKAIKNMDYHPNVIGIVDIILYACSVYNLFLPLIINSTKSPTQIAKRKQKPST